MPEIWRTLAFDAEGYVRWKRQQREFKERWPELNR
jgi:hypothetical protein